MTFQEFKAVLGKRIKGKGFDGIGEFKISGRKVRKDGANITFKKTYSHDGSVV